MKKYAAPEIQIVTFRVEDIITTSNELPFTPYSILGKDELVITEVGKPQ